MSANRGIHAMLSRLLVLLSAVLVLLVAAAPLQAQSASSSATATASATATSSATATATATATASATATATASASADPAVESIIRATWPDAEEDTAIAIAACESGLGGDIYNEGSAAYGIFQMLPSTITGMHGVYGWLADPVYASIMAAKLQNLMGWTPWACAY
jgi:hypothetical protein